MHSFPDWFGEKVIFDGTEIKIVFDGGHTRKRNIRGTEISDTRPFLWGQIPENALGKSVLVKNKKYSIETIEQTGDGSFVYYLGESRKAHEI